MDPRSLHGESQKGLGTQVPEGSSTLKDSGVILCPRRKGTWSIPVVIRLPLAQDPGPAIEECREVKQVISTDSKIDIKGNLESDVKSETPPLLSPQ